jgi:hypothetical protein
LAYRTSAPIRAVCIAFTPMSVRPEGGGKGGATLY